MSFVIIPASEPRRSTSASFGRCGVPTHSYSPWHHHNLIPRDLFGALGEDDDDVLLDQVPCLSAWQQHQLEQVRRQEYLEEVERHLRIQLARQQLEQERQRERARRERAARLTWQYQQEQKAAAAAALEYQRQVEAHRRRQEEFAKRARLASQREEPEWEKLIPQKTLFGVFDLIQHLFEDEAGQQREKSAEAKGKEREKTTEEEQAEQVKPQAQADEMEVDDSTAKQVEIAHKEAAPVETSTLVQDQAQSKQVEIAQKEAAPVETSTLVQDQAQLSTEEKKEERPLFTYPLPQDDAARSTIQANDIGVSFDEASRTIQLTGLWSQGSSSTVTSENGDESRGRKRSRSPKRSRVSDVDETTGEEILKQDDEDEEYVPTTITKSIRLPEGATVDNLRAELTDDGFKVYI